MVMNDMTDDGKWGAAIEVSGVRPDYVSDDDMVEYTYGVPRGEGCRASHWSWDGDGRYYLKADHTYYQQTQTQTLTAQERLEHLENLARRIARLEGIKAPETPPFSWVAEARALVAEMEPVVDAQKDIEYAERCCALVERMAANGFSNVAPHYAEARDIVGQGGSNPSFGLDVIAITDDIMGSDLSIRGAIEEAVVRGARLVLHGRGRELARGEG